MRPGNTFWEEARVVVVSVDEPEVPYISTMRYNYERAYIHPVMKVAGWFIDSTCTQTGGQLNRRNLPMRS
jgi:hypothetical protein